MLIKIFKFLIMLFVFSITNILFYKSFAEINRLNVIFEKKLSNPEKQYVLINLRTINNLKSAFFYNLKNPNNVDLNNSEILILIFYQNIMKENLYYILIPLINIATNLKINDIKLFFYFNKEINCNECKKSIINHLNLIAPYFVFEIKENMILITPTKEFLNQLNLNLYDITKEIYNCSYEIYTPY